MDFLKVNVLEPTDSLTVHIYDIVIEEETVEVSSNTDHPVSIRFQSFFQLLDSIWNCKKNHWKINIYIALNRF